MRPDSLLAIGIFDPPALRDVGVEVVRVRYILKNHEGAFMNGGLAIGGCPKQNWGMREVRIVVRGDWAEGRGSRGGFSGFAGVSAAFLGSVRTQPDPWSPVVQRVVLREGGVFGSGTCARFCAYGGPRGGFQWPVCRRIFSTTSGSVITLMTRSL